MKHSFSLITAALILSAAGIASAQTTSPNSESVVTTGGSSAPASTMTAPTAIMMKAELKDGTKVEVAGDNLVYIVNADGTRTTAPDGTLTLKDGTSLVVKDGKKVGG